MIIAPARIREVTILPACGMRRVELDLTHDAFAELLGVSLATVRKWERGTGEPSGAAKTLLAVARLHPEVVRHAATSNQQ